MKCWFDSAFSNISGSCSLVEKTAGMDNQVSLWQKREHEFESH